MKAVIDTNCFISCIGKRSLYRNVFDAFLANQFSICASNDILLEYEEIFSEFWGEEVTQNLMALFEVSENFQHVLIFYNFLLVEKDKDDNKFVDAFVASQADYLVSNDTDLLQLKGTAFPPLNIVTLAEFSQILKK
jgi:uncharacterized protein